jgi:hypothetical protein
MGGTGTGIPISALDPAHSGLSTRVIVHNHGMPIAWSRNGHQLLITDATGLEIAHADGQTTVVLKGIHPYNGSFTPDGRHVIYAIDGTIWRVPSKGGRPVAIARGNAKTHTTYDFPAFVGNELSPDGRTLFYGGPASGRGVVIALMNTNGSRQRPIVYLRDITRLLHSGPSLEIFPMAWFGDSSGLLILVANNSKRCDVLAVNVDGSDLRHWGPPSMCPVRAALSPDRQHFAFSGVVVRHHGGYIITDQAGNITGTRVLHGVNGDFFAWQP